MAPKKECLNCRLFSNLAAAINLDLQLTAFRYNENRIKLYKNRKEKLLDTSNQRN